MARGGPLVVLQPIVELATGVRIGAEALSRFPPTWARRRTSASRRRTASGSGDELELQALARGRAPRRGRRLHRHEHLTGDPADARGGAAVDRLPLDRVLLELSEHDQVEDYDALTAVLAPLRARGMRLAIDDVGAGFSSLRHIVRHGPDVIKLDRSMSPGSAPTRCSHAGASLVDFGHDCEARWSPRAWRRRPRRPCRSSVDYGQGWHFGRPELPGTPAVGGAVPGIPVARMPADVLSSAFAPATA